jgi:hypothetical protein
MHIHSLIDVQVRDTMESLSESETFVVVKNKGWSFLEDMGYVRTGGIPGEVVTLIGPDAKTAFLHARKPNLIEVTALCDIRMEQLIAVGVTVDSEVSSAYLGAPIGLRGESNRDGGADRSFRYSRYVDLDQAPMRGPKSVRSGYFEDSDEESDDGWFSGGPELDY